MCFSLEVVLPVSDLFSMSIYYFDLEIKNLVNKEIDLDLEKLAQKLRAFAVLGED